MFNAIFLAAGVNELEISQRISSVKTADRPIVSENDTAEMISIFGLLHARSACFPVGALLDEELSRTEPERRGYNLRNARTATIMKVMANGNWAIASENGEWRR